MNQLLRSLLTAVAAGALGAMLTGAISLAASPSQVGTTLAVSASADADEALSMTADAFASLIQVMHNDEDQDEDTDQNENKGDRKPQKPGLESVLDRLVTAGTITARQKTAILDALKSAQPEKPARPALIQLSRDALKAAIDYIGITTEDLAKSHREGKSLADLAIAKSKTRDGLIQAILAVVLKTNPTIDQAKALERIGKAVDFRFMPPGQAKKLPRPSGTPKPSASPAPSASATPTPSASPSATPSATPSASPSAAANAARFGILQRVVEQARGRSGK